MGELELDADIRLRRPSGIRSLHLGELRVSYVPDGVVLLPPGWLPDAVWPAHLRYLDDTGHLVASIGALLVEHGDRALLIDTGFGPQSLPPDPATPRGAIHGGALLDSLATLGRRPEEIEAVAFTHLHPDHTGWALHTAPGADRPPFDHAEHLLSAPEWAAHGSVLTPKGGVRTPADGEEVFPGVRMRVSAGHTTGHAEYVISGGGRRLIAFGDALHSPVQIDHPEWSSAVDYDPVRAAFHRRRLVTELAEPGTIGFGVHFADVVFGAVRPDGDGPAWRPLDD
ncbi:MBL fold metallo-hydrolase [Streptomyces sp. NPDC014006]|uniref:MBL fold metallo-hydrolase n=1 Tax=Streptomyces sp. NPDC014006 TaxID=3364870 RepID=UPI0036F9646E